MASPMTSLVYDGEWEDLTELLGRMHFNELNRNLMVLNPIDLVSYHCRPLTDFGTTLFIVVVPYYMFCAHGILL